MSIQELAPEIVVDADDVARSRSASEWSVAECGWKQLLPDLPDDVIALLATPVVVSAGALGGIDAAPAQATAPAHAAAPDRDERQTACVPTFLAPAPRRAGRHRASLV